MGQSDPEFNDDVVCFKNPFAVTVSVYKVR